jgi:hypothetical protein
MIMQAPKGFALLVSPLLVGDNVTSFSIHCAKVSNSSRAARGFGSSGSPCYPQLAGHWLPSLEAPGRDMGYTILLKTSGMISTWVLLELTVTQLQWSGLRQVESPQGTSFEWVSCREISVGTRIDDPI